ncbi:uncharacterized protein [Oscarella lobularis]|uniref:uncharacterized protein isoform X2 n=1 Tax=Oscarella lobularis TaxID=121494 RepID=UPI003313DE0A
MVTPKVQSNFGACVDVFAPSQDILGAGTTNPSSTKTDSGTSFGTALVSGILAKLLSENPRQTPSQLKQYLLRRASRDILKPPMGHSSWPPNTVNLLVHEGCY